MAMGALLLATSAGAGFAAYDQSMADSLSGWKRTHLPSSGAWTHSLGELGYQRLTGPPAIAKALRSLPSQIDSEGAVWTSPDATWIAVFGAPEHGIPAEAYCLNCGSFSHSWKPLGSGWDGFDAALAEARKAAQSRRIPPKIRKEDAVDPRELRY